MKLTVGVLIIGSLYWDDNPCRTRWRRSRLMASEDFRVKAPIRYGRCSGSRKKTYTMVFSMQCSHPSFLGHAKAILCKHQVCCADDLIGEARELWIAECAPNKPRHELSWDWGCVGLLPNPESNVPDALFEEWAARVSGKPGYSTIKHSANEVAVIDKGGLFQFTWPSVVAGKPLPFDLLLATATNPTLDPHSLDYPSAEIIASAWIQKPEEVKYFWQNRTNGIRTFQDPEIEERLQSNPKTASPTKKVGCLGLGLL